MQENPAILAIDDDPTSLKLIEGALTREGYTISSFTDVYYGLDAFRSGQFDLILSDFYMPQMNGDELLRTIRQEDEQIAFVFLTANTDIQIAIDLVKTGADDHITKPIVAEEVLFRIEKVLREKEQERAIERAEQEKALLDLENRKLVNWRTLYASKDIHQTEQMIQLLSRTINQSGGFLWIDLLRNTLEEIDDKHFRISKELVDMILTSAESQKEIFDYITFIVRLDSLELELTELKASEFSRSIETFVEKRLGELAEKYNREKVVLRSSEYPAGTVSADSNYVQKVVHELLCNAVKYSPDGSRIMAFVEPAEENGKPVLRIVVRNKPIETKQTDPEGKPVVGIPYDFSELVFDLFYTIDSFPRDLEEEEWGDGTGLYVARKLIRRMNGWITTGNGVDYTGSNPATYVRFAVTLPLSR